MSSKKIKLKPGDAVVTNAAYARIIGNAAPYEGVLLRQQSWGEGLWLVDMPRGFTRPQLVHESLMEKKK